MEKCLFLDQNRGLTPFKKCQFFDVLNFLFLQPTKALIHCKISQKTFSWPILPKKKLLEQWPFLDQKPWVIHFGKMSIFRHFELFLFIAQKGFFFFVLEYRKRHFPALQCLQKKLEKWPFSDQNHGLISRHFRLHVFIAWKGVFSFQNIVKDIFLAHSAQKENFGNMAIFGPKTMGYPLWINVYFVTF